MFKWSLDGEMSDKVMDLDAFVTDMHWLPSHGKRSNSMSSDIFAIACSDGMCPYVYYRFVYIYVN